MHSPSKPYKDYCQSLRCASLSYPFDASTPVFKLLGKMFALFSADGHFVSLKCEPSLAVALRQSYRAVAAGYHLNKVHWNTIDFNSDADETFIKEQISQSYQLVLKNLTIANQLRIRQS